MLYNSVFIRSFQSNDLTQCHNITRSVYDDYGNIDSYAENVIVTDMADIEKNYLNIKGGYWWVACSDKQNVIGQIGIQPLSVGDQRCYQDILTNLSSSSLHIHPDNICELRRLAVLSTYQRQGIGKKLLDTLIKYAQITIGYQCIHLTTLTSMRAACQFYEKNGFKQGKIEQYNLNFDLNSKIKYTKSTIFENSSKLSDDDLCLIYLPMYKSHRIYIQHYWMILIK